jgi:hypothetical protein
VADVEDDADRAISLVRRELIDDLPRFVDLAGKGEAGGVIASAGRRRRGRGLTLEHAHLDRVAVGTNTTPPHFGRLGRGGRWRLVSGGACGGRRYTFRNLLRA